MGHSNRGVVTVKGWRLHQPPVECIISSLSMKAVPMSYHAETPACISSLGDCPLASEARVCPRRGYSGLLWTNSDCDLISRDGKPRNNLHTTSERPQLPTPTDPKYSIQRFQYSGLPTPQSRHQLLAQDQTCRPPVGFRPARSPVEVVVEVRAFLTSIDQLLPPH